MNPACEFLKNLPAEQLIESRSFPITGNQRRSYKRVTSYFPALTLSMLNGEELLETTRKYLYQFVLDQKGPQWTWNYWSRNSPQYRNQPYPDDLDDTMCSLGAISRHDPERIDGEVLSSVVSILTSLEILEGGPYRTWILDENSTPDWKDVDLAVNMNLAYFLSLQEIELPALVHLVEDAIRNATFPSHYYPSPYPVIYFIGRWYRGSYSSQLCDLIYNLQKEDLWENELYTALMVSTLIRLGVAPNNLKKQMDFLAKQQTFKPLPFCYDPSIQGKPYVAGSSSLTAAAIVEATNLYYTSVRKKTRQTSLSQPAYAIVTTYAQSLPHPVHENFAKALRKIKEIDKRQSVSSLANLCNASLITKYKAPPLLCHTAGAATIFGWIAYTLYDDIWDEEDPLSQGLATANCCLRQLVAMYERSMYAYPDFLKRMHKIMDVMENSYLREAITRHSYNQKSTQVEQDLHQIAERSIGHMLAPLALLSFSKASNQALNHVENLFLEYLAARQLLDDLHDVQEDFTHGHQTYVTMDLVKKYPLLNPESISLYLWKYEMEHYLDQADLLLEESERYYKLAGVFKDERFLSALLTPLRTACSQARKERKATLTIINSLT